MTLTATGALCHWCEGRGKIERYVASMRRRALVPCEKCKGWGRTGEPLELEDA